MYVYTWMLLLYTVIAPTDTCVCRYTIYTTVFPDHNIFHENVPTKTLEDFIKCGDVQNHHVCSILILHTYIHGVLNKLKKHIGLNDGVSYTSENKRQVFCFLHM